MKKSRAAKRAANAASDDKPVGRSRKVVSVAAAAIAAFGTLVGLVTNIDSLGNLVSDRAQQRQSFRQALDTSAVQLKERKYDQAWTSTANAAAIREAQGWKLNGMASLADVQARQADIAMAWLRDIRIIGEDKTFTEIVERVEPALHREEGAAEGPRKADVIAHLGYADFLRNREGDGGVDPRARYDEALALDDNNPYANAMLAHWLAWTGGKLDEAMPLFEKAFASGREHDFVRRFQVSVLRNLHTDAARLALLRVVNDMRKNGESVDENTRSDVDSIYYFASHDPQEIDRVVHALPPAEHLATIRWLFAGEEEEYKHVRHDFYAALLEEAAGDYRAAHEHLVALKPRIEGTDTYQAEVAAALVRTASH